MKLQIAKHCIENNRFTNDEIYKIYKHGGSLHGLSPTKIYKALKANYLQVIMVTDEDGCKRVYNYVPEENKFFLII